MALEPFLKRELVLASPRARTREELFGLLTDAVHAITPALDAEDLKRQLEQRERQMPTSTPEGIAFPHAIAPHIEQTLVGVARIPGGIEFGGSGHPPCDLVFCMFGCNRDPWEHVRLLARLARIVHTEKARATLRAAADADALHSALVQLDRSCV